MRVALIALPWVDFRTPQPALGALAAYIRMKLPDVDLDSIYSYLEIGQADPDRYLAISNTDFEGNRVYATLLYPERTAALARSWERLPQSPLRAYVDEQRRRGQSAGSVLEELQATLVEHLDRLVESRSWNDTIVGMTTCYSQLFANVTLARRIKETGASATIVLGGATVSPAKIAESVLETYPWIDYVVRGEGELPFHQLIEQVGDGVPVTARGVVSRDRRAADTGLWQVGDLDALPVPDYDRFFEAVGRGAQTALPIEGSRGCWWDRTLINAKSTCHFCNLNVQWDGYRQKSAARVAAEMRELADRYQHTVFQFLDNIVRVKGFDELVEELQGLDIDARFFHEARANMRPYQILRFVEVGLRSVQYGIEALSDSMLKRINKGTSVIMNLEVMKTCAELHIHSVSNLIVYFPGSTEQEVAETLAVIDDYAYAYQPPLTARFQLGVDSVVARFPDEFGIRNVRPEDRYAMVIPPGHLGSLELFTYSFDSDDRADWSPVEARVREWADSYRRHPLQYHDGGSFMRIERHKPSRPGEVFELDAAEAELYRFCTQIRTRAEIHQALSQGSSDRAAELDHSLERFCDAKIMYASKERFLSLATAPDPVIAARRIRRLNEQDARRKRTPRLQVIV